MAEIILSDRKIRLIERIRKQFGSIQIPEEISEDISEAELFRRIVEGKGAGKPHCGKFYVRREGKLKNT